MSTISTAINHGIVLDTPGYYSPLTITSTGAVTNSGTGAAIFGSTGTIVNDGYVAASGGDFFYDYGIYLTDGGAITNSGTILSDGYGILINSGVLTNSGTIAGDHFGVAARQTLSITNTGTITGGNNGIILFTGGSVTNSGGISGGNGLGISGGAGTVVNSGSITGTYGTGVSLSAGGDITNSASGVIFGGNIYSGIYIAGAGTVRNAGTIGSTYGFSVQFAGSATHRVVIETGAVFNGALAGGSGSDTVELAGSAGAPLTVDYNALGLTNFETVLFGAGNDATLQVSNNAGTLGITISGFDAGTETIDLTGIGSDGQITDFDSAADRVTVTGSLGSLTLQFDSIDGLNFGTAPDSTGGTSLIACFRRGTLIRTDVGERPVEELAIGDRVVTASGAPRAIKWIGRRAYDARFIAGNTGVLPIRIEADALAAGVPARDLFVSPEHALVVDGLFLPARLLVNGATIRQVEHAERLEYFHLELDSHDVIFAEGAAAETFVDFGGRGMFHNAVEFAALYPDAAPAEWAPYAALLDAGLAGLAGIRAVLLARAESLGRVSRDPDLHLIVDGEAVRPQRVADRVYSFGLPAGATHVTVASRSVVPSETEAGSLDPRRLGVPFERAVVDGAGLRIEIGPDCPALADGFHHDEGSHRWTDGGGALPLQVLACFAGDLTIAVRIGATGLHYVVGADAADRTGQVGRRSAA